MRKVPPSEVIREEISHVLRGGVDSETNLLSTLSELGVRYLLQQALEHEQEDFLGRGRYERTRSQQGGTTSTAKRAYRNGYEDATLNTAEGTESACECRRSERETLTPYRSKLMEFLEGNSEALERLVTEMYARGLSTRDVWRSASGTRRQASS
jgi:putative transposase